MEWETTTEGAKAMTRPAAGRGPDATRRAQAPLLEALSDAGFAVDSVDELYRLRYKYKPVIPLLIEWLPRLGDVGAKEMVARALSVPWARPRAARPLVGEYRSAPDHSISSYKWAVGNALSVVADDSVLAEIEELVRDKRHGKAREMLAVALGNMKNPRAVDVLLDLLEDQEVAGHAIIALGKLKARVARDRIEPFLGHPKTWVRNEAKRALAKIDRAG